MLTIYIPLLMCISPYVGAQDVVVFGRAAQLRGYDVQTGSGPECAATLFASDADWATAWVLGFDDGAPLTSDRANDLITAWEARL